MLGRLKACSEIQGQIESQLERDREKDNGRERGGERKIKCWRGREKEDKIEQDIVEQRRVQRDAHSPLRYHQHPEQIGAELPRD